MPGFKRMRRFLAGAVLVAAALGTTTCPLRARAPRMAESGADPDAAGRGLLRIVGPPRW